LALRARPGPQPGGNLGLRELMQPLLLVALGGALGSLLRFRLGAAIVHDSAAAQFPYGTLAVNVLGCLAAGLLAGLGEHFDFLSAGARLFLFTGFLGGFTTFSAFGVETIALVERGQWCIAASYVLLSVRARRALGGAQARRPRRLAGKGRTKLAWVLAWQR